MSKEERLQLENELLMNCSKAQAINKYIDELEESSKLSELWCKSQEENRELQQRIDKAINHTHDMLGFLENCVGGNETDIQRCIKIFNEYLQILEGGKRDFK